MFLKCAHDLTFVCCGLSPFRFTVCDLTGTESIDKVCVTFEQAVGVSLIKLLA